MATCCGGRLQSITELYFVSDAGIATCADAKTGKVHWNERLGVGFSASPVFADGRIYFQNEEGVGCDDGDRRLRSCEKAAGECSARGIVANESRWHLAIHPDGRRPRRWTPPTDRRAGGTSSCAS